MPPCCCRPPMRSLTLAAILLALGTTPAAALTQCRALDGDTLACGKARIRIIGLDAPEMRGQCPRERTIARAARDRLAELIAPGVEIEQVRRRDKYRRRLAIVRDGQGRDVAAILISEGHARAYNGRGRRRGWCDA